MGKENNSKYMGEGELETRARRGDKKAIAKLKKQADKMKRSDKFKNTIRAREDMTDEQKMKVMDYVTNNIRTENEVELSKGGSVEFRNGGKVSLGKFKGNF